MQPEFWQKKWQVSQPGFNQPKPNSLLITHFKDLDLPKGSTVFVPLAGKSVDMIWLMEQGYNVVGVELIESVVHDFFTENKMTASVISTSKNGQLNGYQGQVLGQTINLWTGDIFELSMEDIGAIDAVYDRAALVAMPDSAPEHMRSQYVRKVKELTQSAPQLLLNFSLNTKTTAVDQATLQSRAQGGPPFVISNTDIERYYQDGYAVTFLEQASFNIKDLLIDQAWLLTPKG